jgi:superfamily II RNA helicase
MIPIASEYMAIISLFVRYDVLVASDAIGMGLNLNIRRLIFSTMEKFDGTEVRNLTISEIKQIAGRAGRFGSQFPKGEVAWFVTIFMFFLTRQYDSFAY